jgi:predicted tellurium resistance membrane protein TerC
VNLDFAAGVLKIVLIDLALAGDNALVIALAVRTLPRRQQFLGRIWGTVGAVGLRLLFIGIITHLLRIPLLQAVGGLLLIWIAIKLVRQSDSVGRATCATAPRSSRRSGSSSWPTSS